MNFKSLSFLRVRIAVFWRWPGRAAQGWAEVRIRGRDGALTGMARQRCVVFTRLPRGMFLAQAKTHRTRRNA